MNPTITKILSLSLSISLSKARKTVLCSLILAASLHNGVFAAELSEEVLIRQGLIQTALAREPADLIIQGQTVLNVFTQEWLPNQDIVIRKKRIAWVGDSGTWPGVAKDKIDAPWRVGSPGFWRVAQAYRKQLSDTGIRSRIGYSQGQHLDDGRLSRTLQCHRTDERSLLADGRKSWQPAEDIPFHWLCDTANSL